MLCQDPSSRVLWMEFELLAQNTITSAQTVIQQLTVLLGTSRHDETEANPKLNLMGKADTNFAKNITAIEDYEGHVEGNKSEYNGKYFAEIDDKVHELYASDCTMIDKNVKEEHCLDSNKDESFDTYNNGIKASLNNTISDQDVNTKEDGNIYLKDCVIPTKSEETNPSNTSNDKFIEVDTSNLRMVVSNIKQERSWDYNLLTLKVKSKEKPICKICGKVFRVKFGLKKHMEKHSDLKAFVCSQCPKQFKRSEALKSHLKAHEGIYDVKCLQCDKSFVSSSSLHGHMLHKHNLGDLYKCDQCDKDFKVKGQLTHHMTIHTGEKPYKCRIGGCAKAFRNFIQRTGHERRHRGVKEFQCMYCANQFMQPGQLRRHIKYHEGIKTHSCEVCSKKFVEPAQARRCKHSTIVNTKSKLNK